VGENVLHDVQVDMLVLDKVVQDMVDQDKVVQDMVVQDKLQVEHVLRGVHVLVGGNVLHDVPHDVLHGALQNETADGALRDVLQNEVADGEEVGDGRVGSHDGHCGDRGGRYHMQKSRFPFVRVA